MRPRPHAGTAALGLHIIEIQRNTHRPIIHNTATKPVTVHMTAPGTYPFATLRKPQIRRRNRWMQRRQTTFTCQLFNHTVQRRIVNQRVKLRVTIHPLRPLFPNPRRRIIAIHRQMIPNHISRGFHLLGRHHIAFNHIALLPKHLFIINRQIRHHTLLPSAIYRSTISLNSRTIPGSRLNRLYDSNGSSPI